MKIEKLSKIDWCANFESKVQTLRVLNIVGDSLTDRGRKTKKELEDWVSKNADKYFEFLHK